MSESELTTEGRFAVLIGGIVGMLGSVGLIAWGFDTSLNSHDWVKTWVGVSGVVLVIVFFFVALWPIFMFMGDSD